MDGKENLSAPREKLIAPVPALTPAPVVNASGSEIRGQPAAHVSLPVADPRSDLLLHGSLWKALWALSVPLFFTMIATSIAGFTDAFVAGRINSVAQAAIGIGDVMWFFVLLLASALAT